VAQIAFLLADMFEDAEFEVPWNRMIEAGHQVAVVGLEHAAEVSGKQGAHTVVDLAVAEVRPDEFDALVIPGGYSPDKLRVDPVTVEFTRQMVESGKPVAAICHAGWLLAEAGVLSGRRVTSVPNIRTDLINAGAQWVDEEVVVDGNLITSRNPDDLPAFCQALLDHLK
jgi:protease I